MNPEEDADVADPIFTDRRLAALYDEFEGERDDLDAYVVIVGDLCARQILDVGCGTGELALRLADAGLDVIGVDPATSSLEFARGKPGAERVTWIDGDAATVAQDNQGWADAALMTANVAQVFLADEDWMSTLRAVRTVLRPGGTLVFEARDPAARAWEGWTPDATRTRRRRDGVGEVERWCEVLSVELPLVTFRWTTVFDDGETLTSDSTLRFRSRDELTATVEAAGFTDIEVGGAPDRPGLEFVVRARSADE